MPNSRELVFEAAALLEAIGGDPLAGSGFEAEEPESDSGQPGTRRQGRAHADGVTWRGREKQNGGRNPSISE